MKICCRHGKARCDECLFVSDALCGKPLELPTGKVLDTPSFRCLRLSGHSGKCDPFMGGVYGANV